MSKPNPFEFLNSINSTKRNLVREGDCAESDYKPFLTNRALSYHLDAIFDANDMNMRAHLPGLCQYEYYLNNLPKRKRFAKWGKTEADENVEAVMEYFGYSYKKAEEILSILTEDDIAMIHDKLSKGGVKNERKTNRGSNRS